MEPRETKITSQVLSKGQRVESMCETPGQVGHLRLSLKIKLNGRKGGTVCLSSKITSGIGASMATVEVGAAEKLAFKYNTFFYG